MVDSRGNELSLPPRRNALKFERERLGWSQAKVAERLGVSTRTVTRWEQGAVQPYPYYREQLSKLFGKSEQELWPDAEEQSVRSVVEQAVNIRPPEETTGAALPKETIKDDMQAESLEKRGDFPASFLVDDAIPLSPGQSSLLGRAAVFARLKRLLGGQQRLTRVALHGLPGSGKTSLALALVIDPDIQARFPDGVFWAGLGPDPNIQAHFRRWGSLLRLQVTEQESWSYALRMNINKRRFLFIIDDVWQAEEALALLMGGTECAYVLTTRSPQVAFAFASKAVVAVPELREAEGLALLERYVPQLVQRDRGAMQALVQVSGGLPLALTLIGKYLAAQDPTGQSQLVREALEQLRDTRQRLSLGLHPSSQNHLAHLPADIPLALQAVIAVSDQQLIPRERTALRALAVFPPKPNDFSEEAALAVIGAQSELLDALWDAGLLESSDAGRYMLHQTILDYARAQGEEHDAQRRLALYMLRYAEKHVHDYDAIERDGPNLVAALNAGIKLGMHQQVFEGVDAMVPFMRARGMYVQAEHYLQIALQAAQISNDQVRCITTLRHLASFAELRGDYARAELYGQQGLETARQLEQSEAIPDLLTTLGLVAFHQSRHERARALYEEGLLLARRLNNTEQICILLGHLGRSAYYAGDYVQAVALYEEGLALARHYNYRELICRLLAFLGGAIEAQGNYALAENYCKEGVAQARQLGHRETLSQGLTHLGTIYHQRGMIDEAIASLREALDLMRQIGHRVQICHLLTTLGAIVGEDGNYREAERYFQDGITLARELGYRDNLAVLLYNLGEIIEMQGHYARAQPYMQEGVELARQVGSRRTLRRILMAHADVYLNHQQWDEAARLFQESIALNAGESDPEVLARCEYGLARIAAERSELTEAEQLGRQSLQRFEALQHSMVQEVRKWLAGLINTTET